jgi:large subunit ribosomal protein L25
MQRVELDVNIRHEAGKGVARQLRRHGLLPGVLYRQGTSVLLSIEEKALSKLLQTGAGENALITLKIKEPEQGQPQSCVTIIREHQRDPITDRLLHVDLFEISLDKPLRVAVKIDVIGEMSVGVKEGGVLQHHLREIEVECLPLAIPESFRVDASSLQIGQAIYVRDLVVDSAVRLLTPPDQTVISVVAPMSEAKLEELLTATAKETKEPELLKKEIKEGEEGAEGEAAAKPAAGKEEKEVKKEVKEEKKESKAKG